MGQDAVVDEALRLWPPVWIGLRGVNEDFEFDGMRIAAGSNIMFSPGASHRLPGVWRDPLVFDPQRFLPENRIKIPQFAYAPYGGGARTCVGLPLAQVELRVLLMELVTRFDFTLTDQSRGRVPMRYNPTLAPARGIKLRVKLHDHNV